MTRLRLRRLALAVLLAGAAARAGAAALSITDESGAGRDAAAALDPRRTLEASLREPAYRLWERAGFGHDRSEHAAWIVETPEGPAWRPWPFDKRDLESRWLGPPPAGAFAIVHTHPGIVDPRPSDNDLATAARLGIAVYTVSRSGIWRAVPGGAVTRVWDRHWFDGCERAKPCRESVSAPVSLAAAARAVASETPARPLRITE